MKKINLRFKNPQLDFFIKSYISLLIIPFTAMYLIGHVLYLGGRYFWESPMGGAYAFALLSFSYIFISYFIFLILVTIIILFFNKKLMSGSKIAGKTKFSLFLLSVLFYIFTLLALSFFRVLF